VSVRAVVQNTYGPPEVLTPADVDKPTVGLPFFFWLLFKGSTVREGKH
jgi:hypothetical protein